MTALLIHYYFIYLCDIKPGLIWCSSELWRVVCLCVCVALSVLLAHAHTHTHTYTLVEGPRDQFIYMQWKRNRGLEEGIKQKGKERETGNSRELWRKPSGTNKFLYCSQGQTRPIYYLDGSVCVCVCVYVFCFASISCDLYRISRNTAFIGTRLLYFHS